MPNWTYRGKTISSVNDLPHDDAFGFVYLITNLDNGKQYVGKKQLFFTRKKKRTLKARALKDKRKRFERVTTESDWLTYNGSCKKLLEDIEKGATIKKEILIFVNKKKLLSYYELKYQFLYDVLESDSYNDNIQGRFFRNIFRN